MESKAHIPADLLCEHLSINNIIKFYSLNDLIFRKKSSNKTRSKNIERSAKILNNILKTIPFYYIGTECFVNDFSINSEGHHYRQFINYRPIFSRNTSTIDTSFYYGNKYNNCIRFKNPATVISNILNYRVKMHDIELRLVDENFRSNNLMYRIALKFTPGDISRKWTNEIEQLIQAEDGFEQIYQWYCKTSMKSLDTIRLRICKLNFNFDSLNVLFEEINSCKSSSKKEYIRSILVALDSDILQLLSSFNNYVVIKNELIMRFIFPLLIINDMKREGKINIDDIKDKMSIIWKFVGCGMNILNLLPAKIKNSMFEQIMLFVDELILKAIENVPKYSLDHFVLNSLIEYYSKQDKYEKPANLLINRILADKIKHDRLCNRKLLVGYYLLANECKNFIKCRIKALKSDYENLNEDVCNLFGKKIWKDSAFSLPINSEDALKLIFCTDLEYILGSSEAKQYLDHIFVYNAVTENENFVSPIFSALLVKYEQLYICTLLDALNTNFWTMKRPHIAGLLSKLGIDKKEFYSYFKKIDKGLITFSQMEKLHRYLVKSWTGSTKSTFSTIENNLVTSMAYYKWFIAESELTDPVKRLSNNLKLQLLLNNIYFRGKNGKTKTKTNKPEYI